MYVCVCVGGGGHAQAVRYRMYGEIVTGVGAVISNSAIEAATQVKVRIKQLDAI